MEQLLGATIGGLATGGIYAISASGLTLTYSTTGVFNFAHGATGMAAAFLYWELRFRRGVPAPIAFVVVIGVALAWGVLMERGIARRLEGATETTKAVATLALLVGLLSFVLTVWNAEVLHAYPPLYRGNSVSVLSTRVSYNDLIVLGTSLIVAITLRLFLYQTRAGVAMRANVDDRMLLLLNGSDPHASARLAWCISSMLAALAGILVASKTNLNATTLTLLIVNAYAAAVIGRLRSLPLTFAGALALGLAVNYGATYLPGAAVGATYLRGIVGAIPVGVLLVALVVIRADRLGPGDSERQTRLPAPAPTWSGTWALVAAVLAATWVVSTVLAPGDLFSCTRMWGIGLVGVSLVPLGGFAGKLSLAQLSFAGIGALISGHLGQGGNPLVLVASGLAAGAVGAVVALPTVRLRGIFLALSTAGFAIVLDRWLFALPELSWMPGHRTVLWGSGGTLTFRRPRLGPIALTGDQAFFVFSAFVFCLGVVAVVALRRSAVGRQLVAMKDSPAAAETIGLNTRITTVVVFSAAAAMAGVGGALYGMALVSAGPERFDLISGLSLVLMVVVAGINSPASGAVVAVLVGSPILTTWADQLVDGSLAEQVVPLLVAGAAIGLGDNPNGFLPVMATWLSPVRRRPIALAAVLATLSGAWVLRISGAFETAPGASENVWWLGVSLGLLALLHPRSPLFRTRPAREQPTAPLELLGVGAPLSVAELEDIDRHLALPGPGK